MARYIGLSAAGHLLWETLQLPLYTIWRQAPPTEIAFAVAHCTAGDLLIATGALLAALVLVRLATASAAGYRTTAAVAIVLGIAYTVGSEWFNTNVSRAWSYSSYMPTVWGIGVSPLLQWLVVPAIGYRWARAPETGGRDVG